VLQQTAAVFPSAASATGFLHAVQRQWQACIGTDVGVTLGYENACGFNLGNVKNSGNLITVSMAYNGGETGPDACQQALGVNDNVVVEARTCQAPTVAGQPGTPGDPSIAVPDAERVATAMLAKVNI
jgi:hypothetical protein